MKMPYTPITAIRGDSQTIEDTQIVDGQILFDTEEHKLYMDNGSSRDSYGGGSDEATVISYTDFMNLTPQERESGKYLVTGMNPLTNAYNIDYKNNKTVGQELDELNTNLTANGNSYVASYQSGKYGFVIDGNFYSIGGGSMELDFTNVQDLLSSTAADVNKTISGTKAGAIYIACKSSTQTFKRILADGVQIGYAVGSGYSVDEHGEKWVYGIPAGTAITTSGPIAASSDTNQLIFVPFK